MGTNERDTDLHTPDFEISFPPLFLSYKLSTPHRQEKHISIRMTVIRRVTAMICSATVMLPLGHSPHHYLVAGASEPITCFTNCPPKKRHQRKHNMMHVGSSSTSDCGSSLQGTEDESGSEFNLQKARLMARFSSVAYEDPPENGSENSMSTKVEQFIDSNGVTITRPILNNKSKEQIGRIDDDENIDNEWNMAHVQAMTARPLMDMMLSECNTSGMSSEDDALAKSQFEWVALATKKKTSTQFDVWRITASTEESQSNKRILVVAFRGTRLSSYLELYTDLQLQQDMIGCADFGVCMNDAPNNEKDDNSLMAHSGFLKAYASIRPSLLQLLSDSANTYDTIWFTGHSLGAALATLAVVDVGSVMMNNEPNPTDAPNLKSTSIEQRLTLPKANISSYLYGTPRVGNRAFAERLAQLQSHPKPLAQEYYRINTAGDAVVFLPRGKVANRLGIDYVHAGASVFVPALAPERQRGSNEKDVSGERTAKMDQSYRQWMMQLEEDTIEQIQRVFRIKEDTINDNLPLSKVRVYNKGDQAPDPLSEIDPDYTGFFPIDPRTWISSTSFQNFLVGETIRSFRILRGGFIKNHHLATYEDGLCQASQDNVFVVNQ